MSVCQQAIRHRRKCVLDKRWRAKDAGVMSQRLAARVAREKAMMGRKSKKG